MIINLTPHAINLPDGRVIESSGIARCKQTDRQAGEADGLPIVVTEFGEVEGLPDPQEGVYYVVSSITAGAVPHRADVFVPARPIRDAKGAIVGCAALGRVGTPSLVRSAARRFSELLSGSMADVHGQVVYPTADDWRLVEEMGAVEPASGRTMWP